MKIWNRLVWDTWLALHGVWSLALFRRHVISCVQAHSVWSGLEQVKFYDTHHYRPVFMLCVRANRFENGLRLRSRTSRLGALLCSGPFPRCKPACLSLYPGGLSFRLWGPRGDLERNRLLLSGGGDRLGLLELLPRCPSLYRRGAGCSWPSNRLRPKLLSRLGDFACRPVGFGDLMPLLCLSGLGE